MSDAYSRLAPFIQEYLYAHGWTELRTAQNAACEVLFHTDAHLLIAAGTAAGKTEAAFLPVLTLLHDDPPQSIGALYIGPIKALINDQFDRLTDLLKTAKIPVCAWHSDVAQSRKAKLLQHPRGILQITPESLESLLINKSADLSRLFGDLRFVVIDEVHAFIGSERGHQILCQLTRLARYTTRTPRRIGLSATLGDYALAEAWLRSGTSFPVITPKIPGGKRQVQLALEHFYRCDRLITAQGETPKFEPYHQYLFDYSAAKKCLIFANGRGEAESIITHLRQIAQAHRFPDIYHVHHGSIAAPLRQAAENAMREKNLPAVTAATVTFEMGIDIGQLDRVIQLESPPSVASFLQRLGRSGRRGDAANMLFVCAEASPSPEASLPEQIPWQLLQAIAIIQLYLEERWIEPSRSLTYPFSLLYHQTLSILAAQRELTPPELARQVLTLPPFQAIHQDDFRQLLRHWLALDHLQHTENGGLMLGLAGERIVNNYKFYAIFPDTESYTVRSESLTLGSIPLPPPVGDRFSLAGRTWQVQEIDSKAKVVLATPATGQGSLVWQGGKGEIHSRVLQRMRRILFETTNYPYLQLGAQSRLHQVRQLARDYELDRQWVIPLEDRVCCVLPWVGTIAFRTLERFLNRMVKPALQLKRISGYSPYYLTVNLGKAKLENLHWEIISLGDRRLNPEELLEEAEAPKLQKYDDYIPTELLRKAFMADCLDLAELQRIFKDNSNLDRH